ncbi:M20/M25/M40 family metallo-hydrolase [Lutimonas sp.]|uniref:M20/M25/M40 family metallo-hydrolase n=1 Tax=Lutimonas sp. TaxID=1872403 RepID=UPI003D9BE361
MKNQNSSVSVFVIVLILLTSIYSFKTLMPSVIESSVLKETEFSTARAMRHVKAISQKPHFIGSDAHEEVKNYIVSELTALGLTAKIQHELAFRNDLRRGCRVQNIYAKIKGSEPGRALLLMSHYDSAVHASFGASDAGSGVATLLEGLRAFLSKGIQPKNDIIILITDAEEIGLLGAQAFVDNHPWANEVAVGLNFEARGSGGPGIMLMETNQGNSGLLKQFKDANPSHPVANSFMYSIYKTMPNDMDLTILRRALDINGFNFAFINDHFDYHTAQDTYVRLNPDSLKHQGSYLSSLLAHLAQADLNTVYAEDDWAYFNFPFLGLVSYPFLWSLPILIGAFILFLLVLFLGIRRNQMKPKQVFLGFVPLLISLVSISLISIFGWKLILKIHPDYQEILQGFTYNGNFYITAFVALSLWLTIFVYLKFNVKEKILSFSMAPIFLWLLLNIVLLIYLPGGAFFVLAPILSLLGILFILLYQGTKPHPIIPATIILLPIIPVFTPFVELFPIALGTKMIVIAAVFSILILTSFIPVLFSIQGLKNLNKVFLLISILSFGSAWFTSDFNEDQKKPNSISYAFLNEENKAYWLSYDRQPDIFTSQYLGAEPKNGGIEIDKASLWFIENAKMHQEAAILALDTTVCSIRRDTLIGSFRSLTISITPKRTVHRMELFNQQDIELQQLKVNDKIVVEDPLQLKEEKRLFQYYFTEKNEELLVEFLLKSDDDPSLVMLEYSFDLLSNPLIKGILPDLKERESWQMPKPFIPNDAILVKTEINF